MNLKIIFITIIIITIAHITHVSLFLRFNFDCFDYCKTIEILIFFDVYKKKF